MRTATEDSNRLSELGTSLFQPPVCADRNCSSFLLSTLARNWKRVEVPFLACLTTRTAFSLCVLANCLLRLALVDLDSEHLVCVATEWLVWTFTSLSVRVGLRNTNDVWGVFF